MKKYLPKFQSGGKTREERKDARQQRREERKAAKAEESGLGSREGGLSNTASVGINAGAQVGGAAINALTANMEVSNNTAFGAQQAAGDALMATGNPYAAIAGVALKGLSALGEATGTNANTISKSEANEMGIGKGERLLNNIASFVPMLGALATKVDSVKMSEQTKAMSNAYADTVDSIGVAEGMSGGKYFFGADNINAKIRDADKKNRLITDISLTNTQRKASDYGLDLAQQNLNRYAGNNYQNMHVGKHGMKLMSIEECRRILEARKEEVQAFHNGGVIGVDVNVIPEGKYHAHKNHLGDLSEEFEDLTKKGIPVVAHSEGGEIEQVAEIEKMELIFRLEVTEKLEELFKDGSDEAMIEAGKLVAYEIMENTQDNSGEVLKDE